MIHVCQCADPEMCLGCDPTPDWHWICEQGACRISRWFDRHVRRVTAVSVGAPFKHRIAMQAVRQQRVAEEAASERRAVLAEERRVREGRLFALLDGGAR